VAANVTANASVFANAFYVASDYPRPMPSGSLFATVQNAVIANTAELTATSLIASNNRTYITALQTLTTNQGTSLTSLQTTQTAHTGRIAALESSQTSQDGTLSSLQIQCTSNAVNVTGLQTAVTALQSTASTASSAPTALPYYANDSEARTANLPRYALYRNSPFGFAMRVTADKQYMYNFAGGGLYYVAVSLGDTNWTVDWWAYIPRLFQRTMVQIANLTKSISFGLSGGGAFNVMGSGINVSLANPPTNTWCHFGAQNNGGTITYWMSPLSGGTFQMGSATSSFTGPLGNIQFTVGANYTTDYYFQGVMSSIRLCGYSIYPTLTQAAILAQEDYPLPSDSSTIVNLAGMPMKNLAFPLQSVLQTGIGLSTSPMNVSIGGYVV
jgi:hypothetical protein